MKCNLFPDIEMSTPTCGAHLWWRFIHQLLQRYVSVLSRWYFDFIYIGKLLSIKLSNKASTSISGFSKCTIYLSKILLSCSTTQSYKSRDGIGRKHCMENRIWYQKRRAQFFNLVLMHFIWRKYLLITISGIFLCKLLYIN